MITYKIILRLIKLFFYFLSPLIYLFIRLLDLVFTVRVTPIASNRFGHLTTDLEQYIVQKKRNNEMKKNYDIFFTSRYGVCNKEILNLYKKNLLIVSHNILEPVYLLLNKFSKKHTIQNFSIRLKEIEKVWNNYKPSISLNEHQIRYCEKMINEFGLDFKENRFVCLFNRDDTYLINSGKKTNRSWYYVSHHSYNINKFALTADKLGQKKIYLLRMGKTAKKDANIASKFFIDYANSELRSDLMDIYLASNCVFGMGGGTGSKGAALVFRKPLLHLISDIHEFRTYQEDNLLLSKRYYSKNKKRCLTLQEILNFKYGTLSHRNQLDKEEIEMIECSEQELADASMEMIDRIDKKWTDSKEIKKLQSLFKNHDWSKLVYPHNGEQLHTNIKANYSSNFLLNNKDWLGIKN